MEGISTRGDQIVCASQDLGVYAIKGVAYILHDGTHVSDLEVAFTKWDSSVANVGYDRITVGKSMGYSITARCETVHFTGTQIDRIPRNHAIRDLILT